MGTNLCDKKKKETLLDLRSRVFDSEFPEHDANTALILDFSAISRLPEDFTKSVPNLKVFCANGNNLPRLPSDFGSLTFLTRVELKNNQLNSLPDSVQYLVNLKKLVLTGNNLTSLPEDFGEMGQLEELCVDENQLSEFPPTFALLNKLCILEAGYNKLCFLPKYLGNMRSLSYLNVSNNRLKTLPESFSQLEQLRFLYVSYNDLEALPKECSSQRSLEAVFAGCNKLGSLPEWLGHLPEMTELCLQGNRLSRDTFPLDFGKVCKKLRYLDLCGNNIMSLPDSFGELESLDFVNLGSFVKTEDSNEDKTEDSNEDNIDDVNEDHTENFNEDNTQDISEPNTQDNTKDYNGNWLYKLPSSFPQLARLTWLNLDDNSLSFLPEDFGFLCSLEYLNLEHNALRELPESFGQLHKLTVCMLCWNNLQLLPSTFGQLATLEELSLNHNLLAELPESFSNLTQLKTLELHDNRLTEVPTFLAAFVHLELLDLDKNRLDVSSADVSALRKCCVSRLHSERPQGTWRQRNWFDDEVPAQSEDEDAEENESCQNWDVSDEDDDDQYKETVDDGEQTDDYDDDYGGDQDIKEDRLCSVPDCTVTITDEENWDDECGSSSTPEYCIPTVRRIVCHPSLFYMCPADSHMYSLQSLRDYCRPCPEEGQFDSDDDISESEIQTNADASVGSLTDADIQTTVDAETSTVAGEKCPNSLAMTASSPAPALTPDFTWPPVDLHGPKIVRPKYDDPYYQDPMPVRGQFLSY